MPPKNPPKNAPKKVAAPVVRPPISSSSLLYVPQDAVEGYQIRIESNINWTLIEKSVKEHKNICINNNHLKVSFQHGLTKKLNRSILGIFLDEASGLSLKNLWEFSLPVTFWDKNTFGNEETLLCFSNQNNITDGIEYIIKKAVDLDDRNEIKNELMKIEILRVIDSQMTDLDSSLTQFTKLKTLNLSANLLSSIEVDYLPISLEILELQSNRITYLKDISKTLPKCLNYLGLSRNFLTNDSFDEILNLKYIVVLDLSDNDIYELEPVLEEIVKLPKLCSLNLSGNPCSVCTAYAITTLSKLPNLLWLDDREVSPEDRPGSEYVTLNLTHPDDLRSAYFVFTVIRIISLPQPPKTDKGVTNSYHIELELPLLDSKRRQFLMFRRTESLTEFQSVNSDNVLSTLSTKTGMSASQIASNISNNIYDNLIPKNSQINMNFTTFESNKVQWNKIMTFQVPTVRLFCPDLRALRDTFRTEITLRLIYTMSNSNKTKQVKSEKKSLQSLKPNNDQYCVLSTIKCKLEKPDWTQPQQQFQWDDTMLTEYALRCSDEDLSVIQYTQAPSKPVKGKTDNSDGSRRMPPENLTCQFGFSIETIKPL